LEVPEVIIAKPPTAGLWENQTDEKEMGFSYDILDDYILYGKAPENFKNRIDEMNKKSEHKRKNPEVFTLDNK
jgi:NAD+ synthase